VSAAALTFVPAASLDGIAWPAVPAGDAAAIFAILDQLGQSQWWPPALLRRQQFRQLAPLLAHAARSVPFYRDRLAQAGWRPDAALDETPLDEAIWRRIPLLGRRDIQEAGAALDSSAVPLEHGAPSTVASTGSTGTPVSVRRTRMSLLFWQAIALRDHLWHARDLDARLALIRFDPEGRAKPPHGAAQPHWGPPIALYYRTGPAAMLAVTSPPEAQADWLLSQQADYLHTHPSSLMALARHCLERGIALRFRAIGTVGEVVTPELRALCRTAFAAEIEDAYSARETGYLALQCPSGTHYHVQAEDVLVEILDEAGNDCAPGQMGRVVVTPLHELATPLIRYEIGDYAVPGPACACGRGLPVIARILGRTRNMLRLKSGQLLYPGYRFGELTRIAAIAQVQVVQKTLATLDVMLAVRRPLTAEEEAEARRVLTAAMGRDFAIALSYCAEIPRGPGGKFEDFRCEIPD
jgi:phenylacetate-CoA ligase